MEDLSDQPNPSERLDLVQRAARSVKWTTLGSLLPRFVTPISTMILAALLTPADFGVVAVSALVIAMAQIIVGLGLGQAVVQRRTMVIEAASFAFWLSLSLAGFLYAALWIASPWIAQIYHIPQLTDVIRASGISLVLFALGSIPSALMQRELKFRALFWVSTLPQLATVITAVTLALCGARLWALVLGPLCGAAVGTVSVWLLSGWRPSFSIDWSVVRPMLGFSSWVLSHSVMTWLFLQGDNAIAGFFMGEKVLGVYSLGVNTSQLLPGMIIGPLSAVAYPAFCALQSNRQELGHSLLQLQSLASVVVFPVSVGLSVIAVPAVSLLYGDKWLGLGAVIQLLAFTACLSSLWSLNADAYRAIGRPDIWPKISGVTLLILIPLLMFTAQYGLMLFTIARSSGLILYVLLNIVFGGRVLGISIKDQLHGLTTPLVCVTVMYIVAYFLIQALMPFEGGVGWLKLVSVMLISAFLYLLLLWVFNRVLWNKLIRSGRQVLSRA